MRRSMLALLILAATAGAQARPGTRWRLIEAKPNAPTITLDTYSITSRDSVGRVTMWVSFAYPAPGDYPHVLFHEVADCTNHQLGLLDYTKYDEDAPRINFQKLDTVKYFPVEAGSEGEAIFKAACSSK